MDHVCAQAHMCMHMVASTCMDMCTASGPCACAARSVSRWLGSGLCLVSRGLGGSLTPPGLFLGGAAAAVLELGSMYATVDLATAVAATTARHGASYAVHVHAVATARAAAGLAACSRALQPVSQVGSINL